FLAIAMRSSATTDRSRQGARPSVSDRNVREATEVAVTVCAPVVETALVSVIPQLRAVLPNAASVSDPDLIAHREHEGEGASCVLLHVHVQTGIVASHPLQDTRDKEIICRRNVCSEDPVRLVAVNSRDLEIEPRIGLGAAGSAEDVPALDRLEIRLWLL